ncbi:MAG: transcription initiation factor IIB [Thermofilaceae archaeon]|nr:transcription initiation factor IIB [Thermofilaceae archaeon]MCX8180494.1 transcription initiation factor IIB [Thermofilaceae archaeon]MDW8003309.1 transcription initiation factor IIB [Thermofilaceae archaeon]
MSGKTIDEELMGKFLPVEEIKTCPHCGSDKLIYDPVRGEVICAICGYVISEREIDKGPEWRAFDGEEKEKRSRVGAPITRYTPDALATDIDWRSRDAAGRELGLRKKVEMFRLRRWHMRAHAQSSLERNLIQAQQELDRMGAQLGLPRRVLDRAREIYRRALETGLVRGRSIESVVAAAIYAACRELKVPRTLDEISKYTRAGRKDVARCYRLMLRETSIKVPLPSPMDFAPRIGNVLKLSAASVRDAIDVLKQAQQIGITAGKDPAGLAAAAIYIAALRRGEVRTQKEVARAAQVTEVTVRNRYKELAKRLKIDLPVKKP